MAFLKTLRTRLMPRCANLCSQLFFRSTKNRLLCKTTQSNSTEQKRQMKVFICLFVRAIRKERQNMEKYEAYLQKRERQRIRLRELIESGVIIWNTEDTYVDDEVIIAPGTELLPGCILSGQTVIEEKTVIGPRTTLRDCVVRSGALVRETVAEESEIGPDAKVGPFSYLRPGTKVGEGCRVGDFVELKNTTLGNGTKVSHLTYVGDTEVGEGVNFGCGTVTVNYDGKKKYKTRIGNNAFIGCNTNLVAPVVVGDGAYIAAGSTITDAVPDETLAIARARQVIKENWKDKRK
ncbi:MAG: hypothetical protein IJN25_04285 [Clostridia bacterium]|nr:hypothetical protein [Clostridia bacterium]